jgi:hypothetical protein
LLLVCLINLVGIPATVGYFFKEVLLWYVLETYGGYIIIGWLCVGLLSSFVYFFKIYFYLLLDCYKTTKFVSGWWVLSNKVRFLDISFMRLNFFISVLFLIGSGYIMLWFFSYIITFNILKLDVFDSWDVVLGEFCLLDNKLFRFFFIFFYGIYTLLGLCCCIIVKTRSRFFVEMLFGVFLIVLLCL